MTNPHFTKDWLTYRPLEAIRKHIATLPGLHLRFLEIGSFEGRSTCWFMDNFPNADILCVDPYTNHNNREYNVADMEPVYCRFRSNTEKYGHRVSHLRMTSQEALPRILKHLPKFDFAYIDGLHTEEAVNFDSFNVWPLIHTGGMVLWDDLEWTTVRDGLVNFLKSVEDCSERLSVGPMLMLKKLEHSTGVGVPSNG